MSIFITLNVSSTCIYITKLHLKKYRSISSNILRNNVKCENSENY